ARGRVLTRLDATSADAHGWTTAGFYIAGQIGRPLLEAMKKPRRARFPGSGAAMIKQAEKSYAPREVERQVQEFWNRAKVYQKTVAAREKGEDFYFGDGPPFTTGSIHLGQVLNKTIKDLVVRYHRMRGYRSEERRVGKERRPRRTWYQ